MDSNSRRRSAASVLGAALLSGCAGEPFPSCSAPAVTHPGGKCAARYYQADHGSGGQVTQALIECTAVNGRPGGHIVAMHSVTHGFGLNWLDPHTLEVAVPPGVPLQDPRSAATYGGYPLRYVYRELSPDEPAYRGCGLSSDGVSMSNAPYPDQVLPELLWSIAEPVPADMPSFRAALVEYATDIEEEQDFAEFDQAFPGLAVDIRYSYGVQRPSGSWDDVEETVRIRSDRPLSHGELVLRLHEAAHRHLVDQDHHFFEGLQLMPESFERGVPAYELVTGS